MEPERVAATVLATLVAAATARGDAAYRAGTHVIPRLETTTTIAGQPISCATPAPHVTMLEVVIDPGSETGWHRHPVHGYAYVVAGTLEVETADGVQRRYGAGRAFAEVVDVPHNGRAVGGEPVRLLVLFTGAAGVPVTVRTEPPHRGR